jgi:hypothetical protein
MATGFTESYIRLWSLNGKGLRALRPSATRENKTVSVQSGLILSSCLLKKNRTRGDEEGATQPLDRLVLRGLDHHGDGFHRVVHPPVELERVVVMSAQEEPNERGRGGKRKRTIRRLVDLVARQITVLFSRVADGISKLYEPEAPQTRKLIAHSGPVYSLSFDPVPGPASPPRYLLSSSADCTVKLRDAVGYPGKQNRQRSIRSHFVVMSAQEEPNGFHRVVHPPVELEREGASSSAD